MIRIKLYEAIIKNLNAATLQSIFNKKLTSLDVQEFENISDNKFESTTITDAELPLSDFIAVEEYMDNFIDWLWTLLETDYATLYKIIIKNFQDVDDIESNTAIAKLLRVLFKEYTQTNEYTDAISEIENSPEVALALEKMSEAYIKETEDDFML